MTKFKISLYNLVSSLSTLIDLVSPEIMGHHKRTAYLALSLAKEQELSSTDIKDIAIAAYLHDIGALSSKERLDT